MAYEPKANNGSLFINDKKVADNQPDLRGSIHIDRGLLENLMKKNTQLVEVSIAAWNKKSSKGTSYLSLAASEPYEKPQAQQSTSSTKQPWEK